MNGVTIKYSEEVLEWLKSEGYKPAGQINPNHDIITLYRSGFFCTGNFQLNLFIRSHISAKDNFNNFKKLVYKMKIEKEKEKK